MEGFDSCVHVRPADWLDVAGRGRRSRKKDPQEIDEMAIKLAGFAMMGVFDE